MTNWLIIKDAIVVGVMKKDANIVTEDFEGQFDTVQDDPSEMFKEGDVFDLEKWFEYNPQPDAEVPAEPNAIEAE